MGIEIQDITSEAHQVHTVLLKESEATITLRFYPTVEMWVIDAEYKGIKANGYKLSVGVLHMRSRNLPFDFAVRDSSGTGLDPIRIDDFSTGRCVLYMLEGEDMEAVRGAPVPL